MCLSYPKYSKISEFKSDLNLFAFYKPERVLVGLTV